MHRFDIFVDICRLCGRKQRDNINIFGIEGRRKSLENKIKSNINIDVTLDDPLPKTVCKTCCERLNIFIKFHQTCHNTQDKLMNDYLAIVETSTADEDNDNRTASVQLNDVGLDQHMLSNLIEEKEDDQSHLATEIEIYVDASKQISPSVGLQQRSDILSLPLSEAYDTSSELTDGLEQIMIVDSSNYLNVPSPSTLPSCVPTYVVLRNGDGPITLVPLSTLQAAFTPQKTPPNKVLIPRLTKDNKFDPAVYCLPPEEEKVIVEPNKVRRRSVRRKGVTTKIMRVPASKRVRKLVQKVSNTEYRCTLCGTSFPQNYLCEYHVRTHTGEMPFHCDVCGKNFVAMHMLKKHQQSHEEGFRHLCNGCGRGFRSSGNLREHEKMHLDVPAPFRCKVCDKGFYFRASYNGHMETHVTRRDYSCDRCTKNYKSSRHLKEHVARVHEGVTRHACPTCGKCFYRHTTLRQHVRLHTAERPYMCDICGRAFNERTNLSRHKKVHDKRKSLNRSKYLEVEVETVIETEGLRNT